LIENISDFHYINIWKKVYGRHEKYMRFSLRQHLAENILDFHSLNIWKKFGGRQEKYF